MLVFGAEGSGLRPLVARTCDALAAIPMRPPVESLNVSVAAALFLFEAVRQRAASPAARRADDGRGGPGAVTRTLYIVDGYNVLHALFPGAVGDDELFARRDWLADRLASYVALRGATRRARLRRARRREHELPADRRRARSRSASPAGASPPTR